MIDRDLKELSAIRRAFPTAQVLLCWFHDLQVASSKRRRKLACESKKYCDSGNGINEILLNGRTVQQHINYKVRRARYMSG
ncbi:hypothetical protein QQF64_014663 [Cirrhinus molitorella]|uniref:Uncharacterized protein n=1 Tax=Cirrhinus molitorella TaxID=172907 RepID=A0ABR3NSQ9_9TELE